MLFKVGDVLAKKPQYVESDERIILKLQILGYMQSTITGQVTYQTKSLTTGYVSKASESKLVKYYSLVK